MSRHDYNDDLDTLELGRWRGRVASAIRGKRGQQLLREMRDALDAMPEKWLAAESLVTAEGEVCALGCLGKARGIDMSAIDPEAPKAVAAAFGVAEPLVREIAFENDSCGAPRETGEQRWRRVRAWVERNIREDQPNAS